MTVGNFPTQLAQIRRWELGLGDPTPLGLAVTILYFIAAMLAFGAMRAGGDGVSRRAARSTVRFWLLVAVALALLGLNKQLDLQRLVTQLARDAAKEGGWYRDRKPVQVAAVALVATLGVGAVAFAAFRLRHALREVWPALVGLALVGAYVAARVTSLHAVDVLLTLGPVKLKWLLEPLGLALIAYGAVRSSAERGR